MFFTRSGNVTGNDTNGSFRQGGGYQYNPKYTVIVV